MKTRDRLVLAVLGVAALAAAVWFMALAPKREQASKLATKVTQAEARRDAATAKATNAGQAKAKYDRDYATVARLGKAVPPKADVASLVFQLESAARAAKVDFRKVAVESTPDAPAASTPDAPAAGGAASPSRAGISATPFTFAFEGSFSGLRRLLHEIDRFSRIRRQRLAVSGRLLTVDTVALTPGKAGLPRVKAEITAKAYVAPIPSTPADKAATPTASPSSTTAPR